MLLFYLSIFFYLFLSLFLFILSMYFFIFKLNFSLMWSLMNLNSVTINMLIYIDWMTLLFNFTILFISSMILLYCLDYMNHDKNNIRFFYLLNFFIYSMLLMIISPNMMSILLGWDGLGLISYCLVIFYQNNNSYNSGMITILMNRIGDVMILLSISFMFIMGSWNFMNLNFTKIILIILITIASFTKSAQIPFSVWLPAAMAAPTPVSALVHSSTLVTAGIYLMIRFNFLIYQNKNLLIYIFITGLVTMFIAGMSALIEFDIKKIIAYSTLSQLGLMVMIYGFLNYNLTFFHLIIHAMFKSMMFMCSGIIIHNFLGIQDIRYMGNLLNFMPLTSFTLLVSNFSLCGLPFMSGFYSKDLILENMMMNQNFYLIYLMMMLATMLTLCYSVRMMMYLFHKNYKYGCYYKINDSMKMNMSMYLLMIFTMMFGMMMNYFIYMNIEFIFLNKFEKMSILLMLIYTIIMLIYLKKLIFSMYIYNKKFMNFLGKLYFYKDLFNYLMFLFLLYSKFMMKSIDKGWTEYYFKNSLNYYFKLLNYQNKLNFNYMLLMLMYVNILMLIILNF